MKHTYLLYKASKGTFGEALQKKPRRKTTLNLRKPAGFDIIETKFTNELKELNKFFQKEILNRQSKEISMEEVKNLMGKYVSEGLPLPLNDTKQLTPTQRKLLTAAYAKAGKTLLSKNNIVKSADRAKLGLLINRNWPFLKYISETNGAKLIDGEPISWIVDGDENLETESKPMTSNDQVPVSKLDTNLMDGNFKSLLKNLNKVHQTEMIHVLPTMTQFQASPTIKNVEIGEEEVRDIEHFLHNAKHTLDTRERDLFKAKINYELTTNMIQKHPRTFAYGNFFDPVCIPGTLIEINEKQIAKINTKQLNLKKNSSNVDQLRLYNDSGKIQTEWNNSDWNGAIWNLYQIIGTLESPNLFQHQLNRLVKSGWIPVTSTRNDVILVRDKKDHQRILIKRGTLVGIVGFLVAIGVFGINV